MPDYEEYCNLIKTIWDSKRMSDNGKLHTEFKDKLRCHLDSKNILLLSNGHSALECALQTLPNKGEIITTAFTFASTTQSIVHSGFKPVFCDIDPHTLTIDATKIEELITENTVAILGVHVYGIPCDVDKIESLAKKHNIYVIYDAAHSFGTEFNGKNISNYGDMTMFSFHSTKVLNTVEGGAICFKEPEKMEIARHLKYFGFASKEDADVIGFNAKMSEFHAAMGLCNLNHIEEYICRRKKATEIYDTCLLNCKNIVLITYPDNLKRNYSYYPVLIKEDSNISRDELCSKLEEKGIQTRKYFYPLTNKFSCYNKQYKDCYLPVSEYVSNNVLCLPLHSELLDSEVYHICEQVCAIMEGPQ